MRDVPFEIDSSGGDGRTNGRQNGMYLKGKTRFDVERTRTDAAEGGFGCIFSERASQALVRAKIFENKRTRGRHRRQA